MMATSFMPNFMLDCSLPLNFSGTSPQKRARDEDDEYEQAPEAKRVTHSLPFRMSPTTKHTRFFSQSKRSKPKPLFTQTLTPADSEEEISPPFSTIKSAFTQAHAEGMIAHINDHQDFDMDMMDVVLSPHRQQHSEDMAMISPSASPRTLVPQSTDLKSLQDTGSTGRLPTPIYGHFQSSYQQPQMPVPLESLTNATSSRSEKDGEYDLYLRNRKLPSPISEDESMDFPVAPRSSPLETSAPFEPCTSESQSPGLRTPVRMAQPLTGQSPPKGKIMFSMGFRADCEMCRNRVPGHTNHIFRV